MNKNILLSGAIVVVVAVIAIFYVAGSSPVSANFIAGQLAGEQEALNETLSNQGAPFRWQVLSMPAETGSGIIFSSKIVSLDDEMPDIPLSHVVSGKRSAVNIRTTLGDFDGKEMMLEGTGGKEPLLLESKHTASGSSGTFTMPSLSLEKDGATFSYTEISGVVSSTGEGRLVTAPFKFNATFPGKGSLNTLRMHVGESETQWNEKGSIVSTGRLNNIAAVEGTRPVFLLEEIEVNAEQTIDERGGMSSSTEIVMTNMSVSPEDSDSWSSPRSTLKMDMGPIPQKLISSLQSADEREVSQNPMKAAQEILQAVDRPMAFEVELAAEGESELNIDFSLRVQRLDSIKLGTPESLKKLIDKVSASAAISVADTALPASFDQQLDTLIMGGWAAREGDKVVARATFANGTLSYLNQEISTQELMQLFMSMQQESQRSNTPSSSNGWITN